jgi:peptidoglycan/xylan/chitin deacetylase (PgdA/CDA1 family)
LKRNLVPRSPSVVSVDLDPVDLHLAGYGHEGVPPDPAAYGAALPRILEILARRGLRATFFVVARDVEAQADAVRAIAAAGHEVAAHSVSHPQQFGKLTGDPLWHEVAVSRRAISDVIGSEVVGFRAPNWDITSRLVPVLAAAGYRYDASAFPTPLQLAARTMLAIKGRRLAPLTDQRAWPASLRRLPHRWRVDGREIDEFPLSVTPGLRWPVYHTVRYMSARERFSEYVEGFARRGEPFFYPFHAVDALGLVEDGVDPRLADHPGMDRPLSEKLALLDEALALIAERFDCRPYAEQPRPT